MVVGVGDGKGSDQRNGENDPISGGLEAVALHVLESGAQHQHPRRPILLVHRSPYRASLFPGVRGDDLRDRGDGVDGRRPHLPQAPEAPPLPAPHLLRAAPLRRLRHARPRLRPPLEPQALPPRRRLRGPRGVRLPNHQPPPVDANDSAQHPPLPPRHRGHLLRPTHVHRQPRLPHLQDRRRPPPPRLLRHPHRLPPPLARRPHPQPPADRHAGSHLSRAQRRPGRRAAAAGAHSAFRCPSSQFRRRCGGDLAVGGAHR